MMSTPFRVVWVMLIGVLTLLTSFGCGSRDPFSYVPVSGKVTYDDGTPIPLDGLTATFYPQSPPIDAKTYPRSGIGIVEKSTGTLFNVTSHKPNDGLVRGKHKVTLTDMSRKPLPASVIPSEYTHPMKTPLEVDTANQPFELKVRKPK